MTLLIDKYIPFIQGVAEQYFNVEYLEPEQFTPARVHDADALIVRTRTKCNAELLDGSHVQFLATATIGYDHIDTEYCEKHNICWTNAPGCNAHGVCDYVEAALNCLFPEAESLTIGIVGVGHVGSLVAEMAKRKGFHVLLNDPPKGIGVSLKQIAQEADIITFHTPLTREGRHRTYHLCDADFLGQCKHNAIIINAARGGVVNEAALIAHLKAHPQSRAVIDTWEGEPKINKELLDMVTIGTYHIAGYTLQGKINATNMCLDALCKHFSLPALQIPEKALPLQSEIEEGWINRINQQLRLHPDKFEELRETYKLR